jgi:hypothetical protein
MTLIWPRAVPEKSRSAAESRGKKERIALPPISVVYATAVHASSLKRRFALEPQGL